MDKLSIKLNWFSKYESDIINFEEGNSILLTKAKSPYLFIAFEYKKFFYHNQSDNYKEPFKTHLPIQLYATCNGFQHLALV